MKNWLAFAAACFVVGFLPYAAPAEVYADSAEQTAGAFTITAVAPADGIGESGGFHLLAGGDARTLTARVYNASSRPIEVHVTAVNAITGNNGEIAYASAGVGGANPAFATLASVKTGRLWVPPYADETARVVLAMPAEVFSGDILGGISFTRVPAQAGENNANADAVRVLPVRLSGAGRAADQTFAVASVEPQVVGGAGALVHAVQNESPLVVSGLSLQADIYRDGVLVLRNEKSGMEMAPGSAMQYAVQMPGTLLAPGEYESRVTLSLPQGEEWLFTTGFALTRGDVARLSRQTRQNLYLGIPMWAVLGICAVGAAVITLSAFTLTTIRAQQKREAMLNRPSDSR